ncbi:MAG: hypothetical protein QOG91_628 [Candidatus Parcubacteria bacterium]|jgi:hypothetical protein|nr:hypothetical protein [Candidatus Parcubacteria bacterium]
MKLFGKSAKKTSANLKPRRNLLGQAGRDPYSDWAVIFSISFLVAVALVAIGIITFTDMDARLSRPQAAGSETAAAIDTRTLSKVLAEFSSRQAERPNLLKGYAGPGDPSQ